MSNPGPRPSVPYWHFWVDAEGISRQRRCHLTHYELKGVGPADPQWNDRQGTHPSTVVSDCRGCLEALQAVGHLLLVDRAEPIPLLGPALEMDDVTGPHEVFFAPAEPADHLGLIVAGAPEIRTRIARQPAGDGVGFPEALTGADENGYREIRIQRTESVGLARREGRGGLELIGDAR